MIEWLVRACLLGCLVFGVAAARGADCAIASFNAPVESGTISYRVAGAGPDVLLLHGLFAQKEQWDELLCALADAGYRASAPDLPGYAQSTGYGVEVYALENQAELIDRLMRWRGIAHFHLAGNSMGGAIAALYAHRYPRQIASLAFIGGPLGIGEWAEPVRRAILDGINPFIPLDQAQLDLELRLLLATAPELPTDVKQAMITPYLDHQRHYRQVWDIVSLYGNVLRSQRPNRVPTLILWGNGDQIFDVAGAPSLAERYPNSRIVLLDDVGHLPMLDAPKTTGETYADFLRKIPSAAP